MSLPKAGILATATADTTASPGAADDLSARAIRLAAEIEQSIPGGRLDLLSPEALQALIAATSRLYAANVEAGHQFPALSQRHQVMDTDIMVMTSALLRAVNLQVFELGMWQSWTGR